jgi:SPX domain protein involved in polyphosphate accumulation
LRWHLRACTTPIALFIEADIHTEHAKKQLRTLSSKQAAAADYRIPVSRLERYGRLENDVIKAGEEIKSLARFTATQRTAFRKLLKKYKKWTGSVALEDRFRDEVLDDPKNFTQLDLGPLLDEYSTTRQRIRELYDSQVKRAEGGKKSTSATGSASSSALRQLQEVVADGSKVQFDTSIATVPLGESGTFATYFVHLENVVELQVLLLQYARFYLTRSRANSVASPITTEAQMEFFAQGRPDFADYHMLVADNLERFAKEQSALTVDDREHLPGIFPQRAKAAVRWNNDEDALASLRSRSGKTKNSYLKKKHVQDFFEKDVEFCARQDEGVAETPDRIEDLRNELLKDDIRPLFQLSSCRSRLVGLDDNDEGMLLATLDTGITIAKAGANNSNESKSSFPFAILLVRQEGTPKSELLPVLDNSHLVSILKPRSFTSTNSLQVERVRGFSLEYHSIWQTHRPSTMPPPFWEPILSRDIRKLPPPANSRRFNTISDSTPGTRSAGSSGSQRGTTDSATAVETTPSILSPLDIPPLKSFAKKKKRRAYPEAESTQPVQQRYWSEYDHPDEDNPDDANAFVIYIDPNHRSMSDRFFDSVARLFGQHQYADPSTPSERQNLLATGQSTPEDEESSDDESADNAINGHLKKKPKHSTFGTFSRPTSTNLSHLPPSAFTTSQQPQPFLPHFPSVCYAASLVLLLVAYILRTTGRHKLLREVHYGVLLCIVCSIAFTLLGFMAVLRGATAGSNAGRVGKASPSTRPSAWIISVVVLVVDAVGSGGLLAWMLG